MVDGSRSVPAEVNGQEPPNPRPSKRGRAASPANGTESQSTPAKRSRVSRACDQCRASREKCDGQKPICHTCDSQKRACTYDEPPKKRGIQPNYIRTLELTLAWLFQTVPETQTALSRSLPVVNGAAQRLIGSKDTTGAETLHQSWRSSLVCKQIDQMLSGSVVERGSVESIDPRLSSLLMDSDVSTAQPIPQAPLATGQPLHRQQSADQVTPTDIRRGHSLSTSVPSFEIPDLSANLASHGRTRKLVLPQNAWNLLEYYFAFTQSWLPMTEKHGILKTMYAYPTEGLSYEEGMASGEHAELWSLMALAAFQLSRANPTNNDFISLRNTARDLIPAEHTINKGAVQSKPADSYERGHIRALLVLTLLSISSQAWQSAWLEVGLAVRLTLYRLAQADRNTGDRADKPILQLAAFVIEHTVAHQLDLLPHMRSESIQGFNTLDEDGLEEWAPWTDPTSPLNGSAKAPSKAFSTFNALVHELRVADEFQTPGTNAKNLPRTVIALLDNACKKDHRTQPSKLAANLRSPETRHAAPLQGFHHQDLAGIANTLPSASQGHLDQPALTNQDLPRLPGASPADFLTIPTGPGDFNYPNSSNNAENPRLLSNAGWPGFGGQMDGQGGGDIFEELAMLDSVEPVGEHPQFMQNLGFGPDLDLAEFFGPDYQPSNPLLAYMQPPQGGNKPGGGLG